MDARLSPNQKTSPAFPTKPKRVLACVLCQQRKIKCDRKFPCAHCQKTNAQCIPAALVPRQRRRRFPERELLDRLSQYEDLLRKHKVDFEPLHGSSHVNTSAPAEHDDDDSHDDSGGDTASLKPVVKTEQGEGTAQLAKSYWNAMNQKSQDIGPEGHIPDEDSSPDDVQENVITAILDERFEGAADLFFGPRTDNIDLSTLHPGQSRIFKLWHIYLENVDPLLKVTHAPTLYARIVDAASNISSIDPDLEALMFAIYCTASHSLSDSECRENFGLPSKDLQKSYQFGCRQALLNCSISRSKSLDGLTALCLYLIASKPTVDPRSLFSMLGVAIRIAKRMGVHIEALNAKHNVLEAELRRRLWWVLVMYDDRISEMSGYKDAALSPTWDCRIPANLNDVDLRSELKSAPSPRGDLTEAVFAVTRSEIGNFVRRSPFHLDFTNPILKSFIMDARHGPIRRAGELSDLQKMIEDKYLSRCNPDIPLHFITIWASRMTLAKRMMMHYYSTQATNPATQTDDEKDTAAMLAMTMLEADTIMTKSPLMKRFTWYSHLYFPFPAIVHLVQDLKKRPGSRIIEKAWKVLNDNYDVRFLDSDRDHGMFFKVFPRALMAAWRSREAWLRKAGQAVDIPPMITSVRMITASMGLTSLSDDDKSYSTQGSSTETFTPPSLFDLGDDGSTFNFGGFGMLPPNFWDLSQPMDLDQSQSEWPGMNWPSTSYPW